MNEHELTTRGLSAEVIKALSPDACELLATVLEAIDIPHAASMGNEEIRAEILSERLMYTKIALRHLAEGKSLYTDAPVAESMARLREHLAEHPPVGYVTYDQAQARRRAGASWMDAVSLDYVGEGE